MAKKKTIGILAALVTADATQLRKEFKSVDNTIRRSTTGWQKELKGGLKFGAGLVGAQAGLGALSAEVQRVIQNVENIPGINPQAVASIVTARTEFAKLRNSIDSGIASALSFGVEFSKAVGAGAALIAGASEDDIYAGLMKQDSPDDIAAAKDDQYYEKVAAARSKLVEANKKGARAAMTDAEEIASLREEAEKFQRFAQSSSITSLQQLEAETSAAERTSAANEKLAAMKKQLVDAEKALAESSFGSAVARLSEAEKTDLLRARTQRLQQELADLYQLQRDQPDNAAVLQAQIDKTKELTETNKRLEKTYDKLVKTGERVGTGIADSLETAVFSGEGVRGMLKGLEQDLLRIVYRSLITESLGKAIGGGIKGVIGSIFGFADGGRPPVGRPSMVGEEGPELFVPDAAGTIVPNHALGGSGGGRGGNTYYVDARGADQGAVDRVSAALMALAGPGVVERRAFAASNDSGRRGGF